MSSFATPVLVFGFIHPCSVAFVLFLEVPNITIQRLQAKEIHMVISHSLRLSFDTSYSLIMSRFLTANTTMGILPTLYLPITLRRNNLYLETC